MKPFLVALLAILGLASAPPSAVSVDAARAAAERYAGTHRTEIGLNESDSLVFINSFHIDGHGVIVRFGQTHRSVTIYGHQVHVLVKEDGTVEVTRHAYSVDPQLVVAPRVRESDATAFAQERAASRGERTTERAQLVIAPAGSLDVNPAADLLLWRIDQSINDGHDRQRVYLIDAQTGRLLQDEEVRSD